MAPPPFTAAPDNTCFEADILISVKKAFEQDIHLAGFARVTFEWDSPASSSAWNSELGKILMKLYMSWAKTVPEIVFGEMDVMERVLIRWVKGQGKEMRMWQRVPEKFPEDMKCKKAAKVSRSRMVGNVSISIY